MNVIRQPWDNREADVEERSFNLSCHLQNQDLDGEGGRRKAENGSFPFSFYLNERFVLSLLTAYYQLRFRVV